TKSQYVTAIESNSAATPSSNCQPVPTRTFFEIPALRMPAALFATREPRCYSLSRRQASAGVRQGLILRPRRNPLSVREPTPEPSNPLGLGGIEFIEYATSKPQEFGSLLQKMGFSTVARHRSRE